MRFGLSLNMSGFFVGKMLQVKQNIGMVILHHQKKLESVKLSDRPAIVETDLLLYCSKQSEAIQRPLAKPLGLKLFFVMVNVQTNCLIQLQPHLYKETDVLA